MANISGTDMRKAMNERIRVVVLDIIEKHGPISLGSIVQHVSYPRARISAQIGNLKKTGKICHVGQNPSKYEYIISGQEFAGDAA